ncbi:immunity protein Imm33 domain-containing protein [Phytohabitans kaempferiae]|uniref:DUF2185 domain-containing protein n=1 Tax=Phytohabitans kaempferiae TaxID=1620943 RepID=A0ABV6M5A8_9ACTN
MWDDGEPPRFIERAPTSRPDDSGWLMVSGSESEQFMEDPTNFRIVHVRQLVDRFPPLKAVVDAPAGSSFHLRDDAYVAD